MNASLASVLLKLEIDEGRRPVINGSRAAFFAVVKLYCLSWFLCLSQAAFCASLYAVKFISDTFELEWWTQTSAVVAASPA